MIGASGLQPVFRRGSMHIRKVVGAAFVCLLTFAAGQLLFGQATGSISGTVTDTTGSAVPGAKVTVTVPATGLTRSSTTNDAGEYIIPLLGVGDLQRQGGTTRLLTGHGSRHPAASGRAPRAGFQALARDGANQRGSLGDAGSGSNLRRHSRPGDHDPAGRRSALERPRLRPACHADAGHVAGNQSEQLFQWRPQQRSVRARLLFSFGGRIARQQHRLAAGRQRQQRIDLRRHFDSVFDRLDPGVQGPHLQLLGGMGNARRPDGFGHHEIGKRPIPRKPLRVPPQHRPGRPQLLRRIHREVQSQPVWRLARRSDQERQSVFLCRLRGKISAPWDSVYRCDAHRGDAKWRLQRQSFRATEHHPIDEPLDYGCAIRVQRGQPTACVFRWNPDRRNALQHNSAEPDQSDRPGIDQPVSFAQCQQSRSRL